MQHDHNVEYAVNRAGLSRIDGAAGSMGMLRDQPCPSGLDGVLHRARVVREHLSALHAIADRSCGEMRDATELQAVMPSPNGMLEHIEAELGQLISSAEVLVERFRKLD